MYRQILVKAATDPLRFLAAQVTTSRLEPAQSTFAGDLEPFGCCFVCLNLGHDSLLLSIPNARLSISWAGPDLVLVSSTASFLAALTIALSSLRLAESDAPLLTVGKEKALLPYIAQHPLLLHLLSKAFE